MPETNGSQSSVVFDFSDVPVNTSQQDASVGVNASACTYTEDVTNVTEHTAEAPMLVLNTRKGAIDSKQRGVFINPHRRTAFEFTADGRIIDADILRIDRRFIKLLEFLGEEHVAVLLEGENTADGFAVTQITAVDPTGRTNQPSSTDAFVQMVVRKLLSSQAPEEEQHGEEEEAQQAEREFLSDISGMTDFLRCTGNVLPANIRRWAQRNITLAKSNSISAEERRHAQRALSMVLGIHWQSRYFEAIDPVAARKILDEELYGLERVKQRIIETIIQINRTHTLPAYGLLLAGPAGIGKSQIAYAVARILKLPWDSLDMSAIRDPEALTGSPRVYANAKPGRIMEAFSRAGSSNLVFIINELDKADSASAAGSPADALLTLLDNLGYTDNYIECMIPTGGVYPIATANDKNRISEPLMTRFAVIDIPDYTDSEKKDIFMNFSLPRVLARMGMKPEECIVTDEAAEAVVEKFVGRPGCRDLEQAAEHLAANALYRIETEHVSGVTFEAQTVRDLLD